MTLSADQLFPLAEASPQLDKVEESLRRSGHKDIANALLKLQQDAGVQIDREFGGEPAGEQSALLHARYEPVTAQRLNTVLRNAQAELKDGAVKTEFALMLGKLVVAEPVPSPVRAPASRPKT